jgi:hypothetical protein
MICPGCPTFRPGQRTSSPSWVTGQMSKKFLDMGAQVYVEAEKVRQSNKAL